MGEYYGNAGGNDVLFLGDCEVYENFSPITLWQEYGISSCIRGSPQQMIWQSYYLLEEALEYETPKVVVFNVLAMKYDSPESTGSAVRREAYNRMTLDTMKWSAAKWKAVQASLTEEERQWDGVLTYLFPILRYHSRWDQLTWEDFDYWFRRDTVSHNGYLMQTGVKPLVEAPAVPPLADYRFGENSWGYLEKIRLLCEEHGIALVLIKAPTLYPVWWPEWEEQITEYAQEHGLLYLNMIQAIDEIGIDWAADTYDEGLHLNVWGAEKAAAWLGAVLREEYGLADRREDDALAERWAEKVEAYENEKAAAEAGL